MGKAIDTNNLEKYSSAFTLSDMEIFVFPELMFSLVLANIMSPVIWEWRDHPFFKNIENATTNKKIQRLKQFIMDHYYFNLDLETWGLTKRETELKRFENIIDIDIIKSSNALFGYHGDAHYFDLDIRRHFGLDKYDDEIIPYWKTETIEAMTAFKFKEGHHAGAGECVSFATLYAAALFIVLKIPLEDIFLMATPLHSQNFIEVNEGVITNNRRILTKKMWFNGTELSEKARRALEHEQVTIVSHMTGYIHTAYNEATINKDEFNRFSHRLASFLKSQINFEIFSNFLRVHDKYQKYFQFEYYYEGHNYYIDAEVLFKYEHTSKNRIGNASYKKFLQEIELEEFSIQPSLKKNILNAIKSHLNGRNLYCSNQDEFNEFKRLFNHVIEIDAFMADLKSFVCLNPNFPSDQKEFIQSEGLSIDTQMSREEIKAYLRSKREISKVANLAFYAYRELDDKSLEAYLKSSIERNPCSIEYFKDASVSDIYKVLSSFNNDSIYDGERVAMPDEVINFKRGCGLEKAVTLANILKERTPQDKVLLKLKAGQVELVSQDNIFSFKTCKNLEIQYQI